MAMLVVAEWQVGRLVVLIGFVHCALQIHLAADHSHSVVQALPDLGIRTVGADENITIIPHTTKRAPRFRFG